MTNIDLNNYQLDKEYRFESFRVGGSVDSYMEGKVNEYLKYDQLILERTEESFNDKDENKADLPDRPNLTRPVAPTKPEQGNLTDDEYKVLMDKYGKDYDRYKKKLKNTILKDRLMLLVLLLMRIIFNKNTILKMV